MRNSIKRNRVVSQSDNIRTNSDTHKPVLRNRRLLRVTQSRNGLVVEAAAVESIAIHKTGHSYGREDADDHDHGNQLGQRKAALASLRTTQCGKFRLLRG